jgi:hypothetical protein
MSRYLILKGLLLSSGPQVYTAALALGRISIGPAISRGRSALAVECGSKSLRIRREGISISLAGESQLPPAHSMSSSGSLRSLSA